MIQKTYIIFAVGIVSLFVGVVYTSVNVTNNMIKEQTEHMDARVNNQIDGEEYQKRSRESEKTYRSKVADALERIESKFLEAVEIVGRLDGLGGQ